MSIQLMAMVWQSKELTGNHRLAMLAIADSANDEGACWPSVKTLSIKVGVSERQMVRIMNDLIGMGFIQRATRYQGERQTTSVTTVIKARLGVTSMSGVGDTHDTLGGDIAMSYKPSEEPKIEPSLSEDAATPAKVIKLYNETLPELRSVKVANKTRESAIKARIKDYPKAESMEWWGKFFNRVRNSQFLLTGSDSGWRADFDFLVSPSGFAKVIEGKYQ